MKKPYELNFDHSGSEVLENWLTQLAGKDVEKNILSEEFQRNLYINRISSLDEQIKANIQKRDEIEKEIISEIQAILLTKGVELLNLIQLIEVQCVDKGVCHAKIWGTDKAVND